MRWDLGLRLLTQGYDALPKARAASGGLDSFPTRVQARRAMVLRGESGARLFYDTSLVARDKAVPAPLARLLFGRGAVHGLDGTAHARRKRLFLSLLDATAVEQVKTTVEGLLREATSRWARHRHVVLFDELVLIYGTAVLGWAGAGDEGVADQQRSRDLATIVDGFGGAGLAYPRAWLARNRAERWVRGLLGDVRAGRRAAAPGTAVHTFALGEGRDIPLPVAAVELLNVLRPTVAVAWLGCFCAVALSEHPQWRAEVVAEDAAAEAFAQEVRRVFPFVPALAGRLRQATVWEGRHLARGTRLVLDVPGTNQDPRLWRDAERFDPSRFLESTPSPFAFLPQGGGYPDRGHRCPGEPLAVELLKSTLRVLAETDYDLVSNPAHSRRRIPTLPEAGVRLRV